MLNGGPASKKNMALSPAGTDLGLGDALHSYVENMANEIKKKKAELDTSGGLGLAGVSAASMSLLGPSGGV
jgi:hypothetical protein